MPAESLHIMMGVGNWFCLQNLSPLLVQGQLQLSHDSQSRSELSHQWSAWLPTRDD
jgi:hypothetical protein